MSSQRTSVALLCFIVGLVGDYPLYQQTAGLNNTFNYKHEGQWYLWDLCVNNKGKQHIASFP